MNIVLKQSQQEADWFCYVNENSDVLLPGIMELRDEIHEFPISLKDDRRSLVKLGTMNHGQVIAKQPRDKNRRKWMRFLSLFGPAEARRTFIALLEFKAKGIESLEPICLLEKRRYGMVIDSWLLYKYREGKPSTECHIPQIVEQLKALHRHGYQHQDPHFRTGRFSDYYDFMLFSNDKFDDVIMPLIDVNKYSLGYWQARAYRAYIRLRKFIKQKIRRK